MQSVGRCIYEGAESKYSESISINGWWSASMSSSKMRNWRKCKRIQSNSNSVLHWAHHLLCIPPKNQNLNGIRFALLCLHLCVCVCVRVTVWEWFWHDIRAFCAQFIICKQKLQKLCPSIVVDIVVVVRRWRVVMSNVAQHVLRKEECGRMQQASVAWLHKWNNHKFSFWCLSFIVNRNAHFEFVTIDGMAVIWFWPEMVFNHFDGEKNHEIYLSRDPLFWGLNGDPESRVRVYLGNPESICLTLEQIRLYGSVLRNMNDDRATLQT